MWEGYAQRIFALAFLVLAVIALVWFVSNRLEPSEVAGDNIARNKDAATEKSTIAVSQTSTGTFSFTNQSTTTHAKEQLVRFRILQLTFSYPEKAGAVWIDQGKNEDTGPDESYVYRYPYDPENDSDVNAAGEYRYSKNIGTSHFSLDIYSDHANETIQEYIKRNYPNLDLRTATLFRKGKFSGLIVSYPGSLGSIGGKVLMFKSGDEVFKMTNESQMFTDTEFSRIVNSITPTAPESQ